MALVSSAMRHTPPHDRSAVTLLELMTVLGLVGILLAIAMPRAAGYMDGIRVGGAIRETISVFVTARHTATARSRRASVHIDQADARLEVRVEDQTILRRDLNERYGVTIRATRDSMSYDPVGLGYGAANLRIIVSRGHAADTVFISRLGRVRRAAGP